jgi:hypothetical protein
MSVSSRYTSHSKALNRELFLCGLSSIRSKPNKKNLIQKTVMKIVSYTRVARYPPFLEKLSFQNIFSCDFVSKIKIQNFLWNKILRKNPPFQTHHLETLPNFTP